MNEVRLRNIGRVFWRFSLCTGVGWRQLQAVSGIVWCAVPRQTAVYRRAKPYKIGKGGVFYKIVMCGGIGDISSAVMGWRHGSAVEV